MKWIILFITLATALNIVYRFYKLNLNRLYLVNRPKERFSRKFFRNQDIKMLISLILTSIMTVITIYKFQ